MQYYADQEPPPLRLHQPPAYLSHPRQTEFPTTDLFGSLDSFYRSDSRETPIRDQVGVVTSNNNESTHHLPTSLTFKIENELTTITTLQFSNHGAYLAVGTNNGLIRLYCFGRHHSHNALLQSMQLKYENSLSNHFITLPALSTTQFDENPTWDFLIGKGIDITSFGSNSPEASATVTTTVSPVTLPLGGCDIAHDHKDVQYQVHELKRHQTAVTGVQFSQCLNFLLSVDMSGIISLWSLTNEYTQAYQHYQSTDSENRGNARLHKSSGNFDAAHSGPHSIMSRTTNSGKTNHNRHSDHDDGHQTSKPSLLSLTQTTSRGTLNDQLNTPVMLFQWNSFPSAANGLHLSPHGGYFAISHASIGTSIYRTDHPDPVRMIPIFPSKPPYYPMLTPLPKAAWSPNGLYLAIPWEQGRVGIYSPFSTHRDPTLHSFPIRTLYPTPGLITCLQFSPCGRYLFTADSTLTMILWDIHLEQPVWVLDPVLLMYNINQLNQNGLDYDISQGSIPNHLTHPQLYVPYGHLNAGDTLYYGSIPYHPLAHRHIDSNQLDPRFKDYWVKHNSPLLNPDMNGVVSTLSPSTATIATQIDYNPLYLPRRPPIRLTGAWPLTSNGTIHTDIISSCSFSSTTFQSHPIIFQSLYQSPSSQQQAQSLPTPTSSQHPNNKSSTQSSQASTKSVSGPSPNYFPFILSTTSLDGTTKLWNLTPHHGINRSDPVQGPMLADLGLNLLQTIYTKDDVVHHAMFTTRNMLLIATTNGVGGSTDGHSTEPSGNVIEEL